MPVMKIERTYLPDGSCTLGKLTLPSGYSCYTLENPWLGNLLNKSCIPEGCYQTGLRKSPMVQRTSGGKFSEGWEVKNVPGRSYVMFHPGNYVSNTEGCILVGSSLSHVVGNGFMVTSSRDTFKQLMAELAQHDNWIVSIKTMKGGTL